MEERLGPVGLTVVGVHSPEFAYEKERARVVDAAAALGLRHPIMLDNDFSYWRALGNRYWPAFFVVDKEGRLRGRWTGETRAGDAQARAIEALVAALLRAPGPAARPLPK